VAKQNNSVRKLRYFSSKWRYFCEILWVY